MSGRRGGFCQSNLEGQPSCSLACMHHCMLPDPAPLPRVYPFEPKGDGGQGDCDPMDPYARGEKHQNSWARSHLAVVPSIGQPHLRPSFRARGHFPSNGRPWIWAAFSRIQMEGGSTYRCASPAAVISSGPGSSHFSKWRRAQAMTAGRCGFGEQVAFALFSFEPGVFLGIWQPSLTPRT